MLRYLRLYLYFLRFSFSRAMEFRVDFFFRVVMDIMFYVVTLSFFTILFGHIDTLVGWNLDQIFVFVSGFFLIDALHMAIFANNMWMFPFLINQGDLDYYLTKPVSTLFFVSLRDFAANSFLNVLVASGILVWAIARYPERLDFLNGALYLTFLLTGLVLYWIVYMLFMIPVFWSQSVVGLRTLFFSLQLFCQRPHQMFQGWTRRILLSVLPFGLVASYPTQILFEGSSWIEAFHIFGVVLALFLLLLFAWSRGLRAYSSASS